MKFLSENSEISAVEYCFLEIPYKKSTLEMDRITHDIMQNFNKISEQGCYGSRIY